jgi:prephenate dehydrogenase
VSDARVVGPVKIVGVGLIGTSIGLALREKGIEVLLADQSPAVLNLAVDFGTGRKFVEGDEPALIVVCTPPDVTAKVIASEMAMHPLAIITDVASVKATVLAELSNIELDLGRYVGSHPMAGREQSGVLAGRSDIFIGRPWVITPNDKSEKSAVAAVEALALDLGSQVVRMAPTEHDRAVALVSHTPQLVASLLAARLADADGSDISLAGAGLRDTTRIAASDPKLWMQILSANSSEIAKVLEGLKQDLDLTLEALQNVSKSGSLAQISKALERGNLGVAKIPGKHGQRPTHYAKVTVMIEDRPGELARLLTEIGEIGINLEDLMLQHAAGALVGLPELYVLESAEPTLRAELATRGWKIVG